ncbi:MAG: hypothetical protein IPL62_17750 [Caulobacteraceae bacterium]|nr:hypothetical protein [Caulobacteraceae bacterium]MBK8545208.1 hypothetical protein [Caulobacteraceae bacterium]
MIFLAQVTFEHDGDSGEHLALSYQGACGWMAIDADDAKDAVDVLRKSLAADKLKLVEAERIHVVGGPQQAASLDDHLSDNMREWEPGRRTVWGTIHCYVGVRRA